MRLLPRVADALARLSAAWVPDSFSIAAALTAVTFLLGLTVGGASPLQCLVAWGDSFWKLLTFAMQIALVIFAGYLVAVSPPMTRLLDRFAGLARTPRQAVAWTAFLSMAVCWVNWGVGLIAGAVLVRSMARRHPGADYRLLVAAAYLGMGTTWHAGPSGSVPLLMASPGPGNFMLRDGLLASTIPLAETIFTPLNLGLMAFVLLAFSGLAVLMAPPPERTVSADPEALRALEAFTPPARPDRPTPAERVFHSRATNLLVGGMGILYGALSLRATGLNLTLDSVNLIFLSLAVFLHPSPASLLRAAEDASRPLHGVVLQFPLYAGIAGIMQGTGLAKAITDAFLSVATTRTYPLVVFLYSSVLNYFVPSGGSKWAIEAPYVLSAGKALGVGPSAVAMAYAYGDMATNIIQPFWAIPLLSVARLEFRDILGYEVIAWAAYTVLLCAVLLVAG